LTLLSPGAGRWDRGVSHIRQRQYGRTRQKDRCRGNPSHNDGKQDQSQPFSFREKIKLAQRKVGKQDDQQRHTKMEKTCKNDCDSEDDVRKPHGGNHRWLVSLNVAQPSHSRIGRIRRGGLTPGKSQDLTASSISQGSPT